MKKIKRLFAAAVAAAVLAVPVSGFASVLGSSKINGYTVQVGNGTYFSHNVFYSDQSGVGRQTENYITYTPNSEVTPIITNGTALYGGTTISKETLRLEQSADILGGANADYFSFQTGVPMSNAIVDGKILTKDAAGQDGIGILEDGTAFISYFTLASVLIREDGSETNIYNINKYRQPYAAYMMTREFSATTKNSTKGIDVILGSVEGEMRIDTQMTAVVESVTENSSEIEIPEGKIVLTVDANAPAEFYEPIASLAPGERVTLSFGVLGDERWKDVKTGMGAVGGRLLTNGEINPSLEAGAAPRTAVGVREDGSMILYTIDGRQNGYSYGVQLKTLAARMKELGCVDALNLDGGGSTSIVCQMPGDEKAVIMNRPSGGSERAVSTFVFFRNDAVRTGTAANLHFYPLSNFVLTGSQLQLMLNATDSGFHPADVPDGVKFSVEDGKKSTVSDTGLFTAADDGVVTVYAEKDDIKASVDIVCLETPTDITVISGETGSAVKSIKLKSGEKIELSAAAYGGYNELTSQPQSFAWSADENVGMFEGTTFIAANSPGAKGNIYVSAGDKRVSLPVSVTNDGGNDPKAFPYIDMSFENGVLSGKITNEHNIPTEKSGITVQADGKKCDFEFDAASGEFKASLDERTKKISVYVTNSLGYTNCGMLYSGADDKIPNPFSDTKDYWAEEILSYMYDKGIVSGEQVDGVLRFNPKKEMTRSEFAVMIANYLGASEEKYKNVNLPYTDADTIPKWALNSFKALYDMGVLNGRYVSDTESYADPLAPITRAEAATIVARTLPDGFFRVDISAPDKNDIPQWAENGINVLVKLGAINGYEDGRLLPMRRLTKAEAAKILYSVL